MCREFRDLFGDGIYNDDKFPDCTLSQHYVLILISEKIYSLAFLIAYFIGYFLAKKIKGEDFFRRMINESVFVLLDDYYNLAYVRHEFLEPEEDISGDFSLENRYFLFGFANLFNCFRNERLDRLWQLMSNTWERLLSPIKGFFWRHSKTFFFNLVIFGFLFFSPIEYLLGFLTAPCINPEKDIGRNPTLLLYGIIDLIISTCGTFVLVFIISFISLRRELQSLHRNDIKSKAYFMHYNVKKGIIFAIMGLFIKILLMIISGHTFFDMSLDAVSNIYWLGRGIFFLFLIRRSHSRKRIQIHSNCDALKETSKFYHIQTFLYKHRLNLAKFLEFGRKSENFIDHLEEKLKKDISLKIKLFRKMNTELEAQKFKNILVKKNLDSSYHAFLATLFTVYFGVYIVLTIMSTLTVIDPQNTQLADSCVLNSAIVGYSFTDFIEITTFPYLFYKTTKKASLIS